MGTDRQLGFALFFFGRRVFACRRDSGEVTIRCFLFGRGLWLFICVPVKRNKFILSESTEELLWQTLPVKLINIGSHQFSLQSFFFVYTKKREREREMLLFFFVFHNQKQLACVHKNHQGKQETVQPLFQWFCYPNHNLTWTSSTTILYVYVWSYSVFLIFSSPVNTHTHTQEKKTTSFHNPSSLSALWK